MVPSLLRSAEAPCTLRWGSLSVEGRKKRQATVAIQAEPNLHLPGFLHPNVKQLLAQRKDIITNRGLHLKAKSLDLVIASISLFRSQRAQLVSRNSGIDALRPRIDTTLHVVEISKTLLPKILRGVLTTNPVVTLKNYRGILLAFH